MQLSMFLKDNRTKGFSISSHGLCVEQRKGQETGNIYSFSGGGFSPKAIGGNTFEESHFAVGHIVG